MSSSILMGSANAKAAMAAGAAQFEENRLLKIQSQMSAAKDSKKDSEVWKAAEGFEEIFLTILMRQMRNTVFEAEDSLDSSNASKTYKEMFDDQIAKVGAKSHTFGLAKMIHDSMVRDMAITKDQDVKKPPIELKMSEETPSP
jgi:peptidoglycan hydrolase FlgJ